MSIKTPEQIVTAVFKRWQTDVTPAWGDGYYTPSDDQFAEMAREAIEADRAQREFPMSDPIIELREWATTVSTFMAEDKSNDWSEEIAQLEAIEERLGEGK